MSNCNYDVYKNEEFIAGFTYIEDAYDFAERQLNAKNSVDIVDVKASMILDTLVIKEFK